MATTLAIDSAGERFVLSGRETFLLGASYHAALGAPKDFIEDDLSDLKIAGVNWLRVWATWAGFDHDISAVDADGDERAPYWRKLLWLCEFADKLSVAVAVTLSPADPTSGAPLLDGEAAHLAAAAAIAEGLRPLRNVYFDLAAERNQPGPAGVPIATVRKLRDLVKRIDPDRLVTASHAGDIEPDRLYEYLVTAKVDFLAPHRPLGPASPGETEAKTRTLRSRMARLGKVVPIHYQQPFRRDAGDWQPTAEDFLADLTAALAGGAAGWCFHNGPTAGRPNLRPRRCFDLRPAEGRLIDQLQDDERTVLSGLKGVLGGE